MDPEWGCGLLPERGGGGELRWASDGFPVAISMTTQPSDQMSAARPWPSLMFFVNTCKTEKQSSKLLRSHIRSVADPECLSRIPDPHFYPSRIPDPKTATKERGGKKIFSYFFCCNKFHKIEYFFYFWNAEEKNWAEFSKNYWRFTQIIFTKLSNIWVWIRNTAHTDMDPDPVGLKKLPWAGTLDLKQRKVNKMLLKYYM